jgi:DNA modification methylase
MVKVEVKTVKLGEIKLNPDNPRTISKKDMDLLVKSLKDFPEMLKLREIVVDETMTILGGNMRYLALQKSGAKEATAKVVTGLTPAQKREFVIKDNGSMGDWNMEDLANSWADLPLADWGVDLPDDWLGADKGEPAYAEPQIDKAEELNKVWRVTLGDLWQIGEHRLLCGDSTKKEDVGRVMGERLANLVWTDPPYGVKYGEKMESTNPMHYRVRSIKNDNLPVKDMVTLIRNAYKLAAQYSVKGGAIYAAAAAAGDMLKMAIDSFEDSGFTFKWQLVWVKDSLVLSRADYHFRHENVLYGWKEDGAHFFIDDRKQDSVFEYARPKKSEEHPMMKPIDLVMHMIKNSSKIGDLIYDPFSGSGCTIISCQNLNRLCRCIELSPDFCAVILQRMHDAFPDLEIRRVE